MSWVVLGSLFDFIIVVPILLFILTKRKIRFHWKALIAFSALGAICARFIIPKTYFEPFGYIAHTAVTLEAIFVLLGIGLLFVTFWQLPKIIKSVKEQLLTLFSLPKIMERRISQNYLVRLLAAEFLIFYYAFASWKKKPPTGTHVVTLHKNTSLIAYYIMLIHAILVETIVIHWWIHEISFILSIILLILNLYTVIFFVADIQAIRLNPLTYKDKKIYLSLGASKSMEIPIEKIKDVQWEHIPNKLDKKTTIDFIARDMESLNPHCILHFKQPITAHFAFGLSKSYEKVAIRVDDPQRLKSLIVGKIKDKHNKKPS